MDKAIIIGVYDYLGFHLCLKFLEQGLEVIGVHVDKEMIDLFYTEKKLLIGRNSNFTEIELDEFNAEDRKEKTFIFIDFYSSYYKHQEIELMASLQKKFTGVKLTSMVSLLPIQFCGNRIEEQQTFFQSFHEESAASFFYLPSVYGPWQPLQFALQQSLYAPKKELVVSEREWTEDAVYVEDVIDAVYGNFEKPGINKYILRSTIKNHWQQLIGTEQKVEHACEMKYPPLESEKEFIILKIGQTEPKAGIAKQKDHLYRLLGKKHE